LNNHKTCADCFHCKTVVHLVKGYRKYPKYYLDGKPVNQRMKFGQVRCAMGNWFNCKGDELRYSDLKNFMRSKRAKQLVCEYFVDME
jgi:hypothetical protein